jgi:HPt (histidine-containing phosphotransfer) domain-containing protein
VSDVLDPAALERVDFVARRGDPLLLARLVELFLADAPERLRSLRDAFEQHDDARVRALAHGLRGSSETFGAHEMAAHCDFLEHMPSEWAAAEIERHLAGLIESFTRTQAALESLVAQQARSGRDAPP